MLMVVLEVETIDLEGPLNLQKNLGGGEQVSEGSKNVASHNLWFPKSVVVKFSRKKVWR